MAPSRGSFPRVGLPFLAFAASAVPMRQRPLITPQSTVVLLTGLPGDVESESRFRDELRAWLEILDSGQRPGKVFVQDGAIVMDKGKQMTGITYTRGDFPKMHYEVTLEGKKAALLKR